MGADDARRFRRERELRAAALDKAPAAQNSGPIVRVSIKLFGRIYEYGIIYAIFIISNVYITIGGDTKKDALIELMYGHAGRITTKQAREAGFSSSMLQLLVSQGLAVKESRGVFALAGTPLDDFAVISLRWPKAVFRCSSSLYLHGMTDIVPGVYEISLPRGYKENGILEEFPSCLVLHESRELYGLGVAKGVSPTGMPLLLHDRERSVCDLVLARKRGEADTQLLRQAMREYFGSHKKNLPQLMRYAKKMGVAPELQTYLEVLS